MRTTRALRHGRPLAALATAGFLALTLLPGVVRGQDATPTPAPSFVSAPGAVTLAAYSTPREAYEEIIPLFGATEAGAGVTFEQSYGASGDQSRAVEAGLPADVVALSLWPDVERLVKPGIVAPDWDENDSGGMVHDSVVVLDVRPGNPKGITGWDDLARDDVSVITPNPFTSGGAQWNLLAAYQAQIEAGKTVEEAKDYLAKVIANTDVMDRSARESLATFAAGQGDVLIGYENEAIFAKQAGQPIDYIVPDATMLIENPVAVTLTSDAPEQARAFVDFLYSPDAQRVFGQHGFRPVEPDVLAEFDFPTPPDLFTIEALGGWSEARPTFFDPDDGIVAEDLPLAGPRRVSTLATSARPARRSGASARYDGRGLMGPGFTALYLGLLVLIPIAAVVWRSVSDGPESFLEAVTSPQAIAALKLTFTLSFVVVAVNALMGPAIAWVLVRDDFPGKAFLNALIDLPFALPTIVAGLTLLALYGPRSPFGLNVAYSQAGIVLALLFITLPFVVRAVQPVLTELDRDMEEAAASLGAASPTILRRIVVPNLLPAILTGSALAFARCIGEFGSIVLISGNIPYRTETAAVYIYSRVETDDAGSAAAVSVVLLVASLALLTIFDILRRRISRHEEPVP